MSQIYTSLISHLVQHASLSSEDTYGLMKTLMNGELSPVQIAAIAIALRMKGETVDELVGFARAMRDGAVTTSVDVPHLVDTCGTGGDGLHTFNISTTAAFVAAAAGIPVAKHGNRAASSVCGSADVLEELGVNLNLSPDDEKRAIHTCSIAFLFARTHHPALKHAAPVRAELGTRTFFNLLGPLTNPAGARIQLMGVFDNVPLEKIAHVAHALGVERAMIVHAQDGMDEISTCSPTSVAEVKDGSVTSYTITPEDMDIPRADLSLLKGGDAHENAAITQRILHGEKGPCADIVALNAGAVIYLAGKASSHQEGVAHARDILASGAAHATLEKYISFTHDVAKEA